MKPKNIKSVTDSIVSPAICHEVMALEAMILVFRTLSLNQLLCSSFTFIKRLFSSSLLAAIRVVSSTYVRLLIFLLAILISICHSSSLAFCMMHSAHKLHKQGDKPCHTTFPILNQSVVLCPCLIVAS